MQTVIEPLADTLIANNFEIKPVLKSLFTSQHFFDVKNIGCAVKSPYDLIIGAMRQLIVKLPNLTTDYGKLYTSYGFILDVLIDCNLRPLAPPSVAGYTPYYQAPQFAEAWVTPHTILYRNKFLNSLLFGFGRSELNLRIQAIPTDLVKQLDNPESPTKLVQELVDLLLGMPVPADVLTYMKNILLGGQTTESYWTNAWNGYLTENSASGTNTMIVNQRLDTLFKYIMTLAEVHLS